MTRLIGSTLTAFSFLAALACGDGLTDSGYRGEALFRLTGTVQQATTDSLEGSGELRLALFWALHEFEDGEAIIVENDQVLTTAQFPARYELRLFTPPPPDSITSIDGAEGKLAFGSIGLYLDTNGNAQWNEGESILGGPREGDQVLAYTPQGVFHDDWELGPGYHLMRIETEKLCAQEKDADDFWLTPITDGSKEAELPLVISAGYRLFIDLDCDGQLGEWAEVCDDDVLIEMCEAYLDADPCVELPDECLELALCIDESYFDGCEEEAADDDGGVDDGGVDDGGVDDSGVDDSGGDGGEVSDGGVDDGGIDDSGTNDSGTNDSGTNDSGFDDGGIDDGGETSDSGLIDDGSLPDDSDGSETSDGSGSEQESGTTGDPDNSGTTSDPLDWGTTGSPDETDTVGEFGETSDSSSDGDTSDPDTTTGEGFSPPMEKTRDRLLQ